MRALNTSGLLFSSSVREGGRDDALIHCGRPYKESRDSVGVLVGKRPHGSSPKWVGWGD